MPSQKGERLDYQDQHGSIVSLHRRRRAQARHLGQLLNSVCKRKARVALILLGRASGEITYIMLSTLLRLSRPLPLPRISLQRPCGQND